MTFAAVGTVFGQANSATFTFAPAGLSSAGHFALVEVIQSAASVHATGITSTNATWTRVGVTFNGSTNPGSGDVFLAQITSTSSATATVTYSGTASGEDTRGQEFTTSAGFPSVTFDVQGHIDSAGTNTWASLTPGHGAGELYFGFVNDSGTFAGTNGTPAGYVYQTPTSGNGMAYNVSCPNSATGAVGTDGGSQWGVMVLLYEATVATPTQYPQRQRFKTRQTLQFPTPSTAAAVAVPAPVQVVPVPRERPRRAVWARVTGQAYVAVPAPPREPPQPRRKPARAVWRGSAPFLGYTAVPAPAQEYRTPPRRQLARAVWRGGQGAAYVAVPAPVQQPQPAPRRKPDRAVVEFVPVVTTNAAPTAVAVPAPPQSPYVAPRRKPGRVLWHGGAGQAYVAVPAPVQQYRTPPRRRPARAQVRGGTGPAFAFVPAPRQQPGPAPRRRPARAQVRFVPVRTTNGAVVVVAARPGVVADYDGKTWWKKKWILRL